MYTYIYTYTYMVDVIGLEASPQGGVTGHAMTRAFQETLDKMSQRIEAVDSSGLRGDSTVTFKGVMTVTWDIYILYSMVICRYISN